MASLAIVIGIDQYGTEIECLDGAVRDAIGFAEWLVGPHNMAPTSVYLGLAPTARSPAAPPALADCPTFTPDVAGVAALLHSLHSAQGDTLDEIFFFFSGHGAAAIGSEYTGDAICLAGFSAGRNNDALEWQSVQTWMNAFKAQRRFIFLDKCRNAVSGAAQQFAHLDPMRPVADGSWTFVLLATALGAKAVGTAFGGLFSHYLIDGLKGSGSAKQWDATMHGGAGGYQVRLSSLHRYIAEKVCQANNLAANQQVMRMGESPSTDYVLASFGHNAFKPIELTVRLLRPNPHAAAEVLASRDGDFAPHRKPFDPNNLVLLSLPPAQYHLAPACVGYSANPQRISVSLYEPVDAAQVALDLIAAGGPPPPSPSPPDTGAPDGEGEPGALALTVGETRLAELNPPLRIRVRRSNGEVVASYPFADPLPLDPGLFQVRVSSADGAVVETDISVASGQALAVDVPVPGNPGPALAAALHAAAKDQPRDGRMLPSESLGWINSSALSTLALVAAGQAVQRYAGNLKELGLGTKWIEDGATGILGVIAYEAEAMPEVASDDTPMVADEGGAVPDAPAKNPLKPDAWLWRMGRPDDEFAKRELRMYRDDLLLSHVDIKAPPDGYWVELEDPATKRRSGFKLATAVFDDHVTIIIRYVPLPGRVEQMQFSCPRAGAFDRDAMPPVLNALVQAEAFQRSRLMGHDPLKLPTALSLANGEWFEAFSAFLLGASLAGRMSAEAEGAQEMFEAVVSRLADGTPSVDSLILQAMLAERRDDGGRARDLYRGAAELGRFPVVDRLLDPFLQAFETYGIESGFRRQLDRVTGRSIGHPLWTILRDH